VRLLPRILADENELDGETEAPITEPETEPQPRPSWRILAIVGLAALLPRLVYLFAFTDPENAGEGFTDAYHHWQIAYLTKEIGLSHGPRLWDLRGWEYYWGLLHPALMDAVYFVTGSSDIVLNRLVSVLFGSACVVLIFLICNRYWGMRVAAAAAAFAALLPAAVFNDAAGMAEPLSVALILLGIWLAPANGFWAGVALGLAAMARTEAWLFSGGLVLAWVLGARARPGRWWLAAGWAATMLLYAKFLFDQTGNPVYPFYWSFLFVGFGEFNSAPVLSTAQQSLGPLLAVAALACLAGVGWSLWKRPAPYLLLVYGFGYSAYSFATFLIVDAWKERRFELPLDFAAILCAVALFSLAPRRVPAMRTWSIGAAVLAIAAVQLSWVPIQSAYAATESDFQRQVALGRAIGDVYAQPEYRGGVIAVPGDEPTLVYTMYRYGGIPGSRLTSEFYDPFYYLPAGTRYADNPKVVGPLLSCWLVSTGTRLFLVPPASEFNHSVPDYLAFMADHPYWFADTHAQLSGGLALYAVSIPPGSASCQVSRNAA